VPKLAVIAVSAATIFMAWADPLLAQQTTAGLLPAPSTPGPDESAGNGSDGGATGSIARSPLAAPTPDLAPDAPDPAAATALNRHLDAVQDLLTDQENVRPDMVEQGEKLAWGQMDQAIEDGDFADANSAEKQIGWVARGRNGDRPKLRRPKVDLKAMTRLRLNENGSTVLDIAKGAIVTRF